VAHVLIPEDGPELSEPVLPSPRRGGHLRDDSDDEYGDVLEGVYPRVRVD
jgi:hypothetical protein